MKIVNRGYMLVTPTQAFLDWANSIDSEINLSLDFIEGNIYLIEEDFMETEPIVLANFKKILKNEFESVTDEMDLWPEKLTIETFLQFFTFAFGSMIFDLQKDNLKAE